MSVNGYYYVSALHVPSQSVIWSLTADCGHKAQRVYEGVVNAATPNFTITLGRISIHGSTPMKVSTDPNGQHSEPR